MKTVVYQSFRTNNVPRWIEMCMQTVKSWAKEKQFDYVFFDDAFFEYAPAWYREKVGHQICPVTDLSRLVVAKEFLAKRYDRAIWVDADMLVFNPTKLSIKLEKDFIFSQELWIYIESTGVYRPLYRVNNSITAFCKDNVHLDFFIDACMRLARTKNKVDKLDIGTHFLSQLQLILPFSLLTNVGILSPAMIEEISTGKSQVLREYAKYLKQPLACANFCASLQGQEIQGATAEEKLFELAVEKCLVNRGEVINRHLMEFP